MIIDSQKIYNTYCHLWAADQEEVIEAFAATNPLTVEIRDKFIQYDNETKALQEAPKTTVIGSIIISMDKSFDAFTEHAKTWKVILGKRLSVTYKKQLDEMVNFIKDQEFILVRPLRDLDDVRMAMTCLDKIREVSIE